MTVLIYCLAAIAIVLGYIYTITFMTALAASLAGVVVAIAASLVFETSKLALWHIGISSLKTGLLARGIVNITVSLLLVCLSITAIMYSMIIGNATQNAASNAVLDQRAIVQSKVDNLQSAIKETQAVIANCAAQQLLTRCVQPKTQELNELRSELKRVQGDLTSMPTAKVSNDEFWNSIAIAFDTTAENAKTSFIIARSFLLEFLAMFLLALGVILRPSNMLVANANSKQSIAILPTEATDANSNMLLANANSKEPTISKKVGGVY
jgi:hypothetical protein